MRALEFEKPIIEIEEQIKSLEREAGDNEEVKEALGRLKERAEELKLHIYSNLSRWQLVQIARHPDRPHSVFYIHHVFEDFEEIHGDRNFRDDPSIITGFAYLDGMKVAVIAEEKGNDTRDKIYRNFGMPHPEGYRKAMRVMELADRFGIPLISLVDTPGAYPGIGAEERGQSQAIAENIRTMLKIKVPFVAVVIGEGGSGGALAIAVADRVLAMEYSIYSVISPEGCASILWKDAKKANEAAEALKLTAKDLKGFGIIDDIIPEPLGGAHRDPMKAMESFKEYIMKHLRELKKINPDKLLAMRREKYASLGAFTEKEGVK